MLGTARLGMTKNGQDEKQKSAGILQALGAVRESVLAEYTGESVQDRPKAAVKGGCMDFGRFERILRL